MLPALRDLGPERARQCPGDHQQAEDEHPEPGPQVDVDARRLVDLLLAVEQAENGQQEPVDDEQPADDAAEIEEVGGAAC